MEVTHRDDHVTHAVIGGSEKIDFQVSDSGFLMQMLSSSLYKDQLMAVAREVLCNADDAHKENGVTRPFEVSVTSEKFIIRDFGPGIPHDKIGPIYATYGGSTKRDNDKATGGFGLGCKSPFAYTDNFQVTSYNNGVKTIYRMSKSDSEVEGKPSIIKIVSVPTQETGLEVSINLNSHMDSVRVAKRVKRVLANGEMNALYNGVKAEVMPFHKMTQGYMLTNEDPLLERHRILVRYGAVIYPVDEHDSYDHLYRKVVRVINMVDNSEYRDGTFSLILQAEPGSLSLTPSRETLTITGKTTETVTKLLENFLEKYKAEYKHIATELYMEGVDKAVEAKDTAALVSSPSLLTIPQKYVEAPKNDEGTYYYITDANTMARWDLQREYLGLRDSNFLHQDLIKRMNYFIHTGEGVLDRGLLRGLKKAMSRSNKRSYGSYVRGRQAIDHFRRKLVYPVLAKMRATRFMQKSDLFVLAPLHNWAEEQSHYRRGRVMVRVAHIFAPSDTSNFFPMMRRLVVITHDENQVEDRLRNNKRELPVYEKHNALEGALVYRVGRAKAKVDEVREFFANLKGFDVIDLTKEIEYRAPKQSSSTVKERRKGYATLSGVFVPATSLTNAHFDWQRITSTEERVETPEAYAVLFGKKSEKRGRVVGCHSSEQAQMVMRCYGNRIAALINDGAITKLSSTVPGLTNWLPKQILKEMEDPALLAALPGTSRVFHSWLHEQDVDGDFVELLFETPELRAALKVPALAELSPEQEQIMKLIDSVCASHTEVGLSAQAQKIADLQPTAQLVKVIGKLKSNPMLSMVDTKNIQQVFKAGVDPELKAKTLKLLKTVIKG